MAALTITEAELLEALAAAQPNAGPEDAMSTQEMAEAVGVSVKMMLKALHQMQKEQRLHVHKGHRLSIDGKMRLVPLYTILPKT